MPVRFLTTTLLLLTCATLHAQPVLRVTIDSAWGPPQVYMRNGQAEAGIFIDAIRYVARQLNADLRVVPAARKRLLEALERNQSDMVCHLNPRWLSQTYPDARWTGPFIEQENVIVRAPAVPAGQLDLAHTNGQHIGTLLGYRYPRLEEAFDKHALIRVEATDASALLANVALNRVAYAVANRFLIDSYNRDAVTALEVDQTLDVQATYCLLAANPRLPAQHIRRALETLHSSGELRRIIARYRQPMAPAADMAPPAGRQ
ncbi:substrate-binding periplasmic protein [Chitinibacteraceae bacterium HSL-7]